MDDRTGGPAFPTANPHHPQPSDGMSLRAWFAGQALPTVLQFYRTDNTDWDSPAGGRRTSRVCCDIADALLAALAEERP